MFSKLTSSSLYRTTAFMLLAGMIILLMILGKALLIPLAFAAFLAIILSPLCEWLEKRGIHGSIAAFLCLLVATLVIGGIITFFIMQMSALADNVSTFEENLNQMIRQGAIYLGQQLSDSEISRLSSFKEALGFMFQDAQSVLGTLLVIIASSFVYILFLFTFIVLFLIYRKDFVQFAVYLLGDENHSMQHMLLKIERVVRNYLVGIFQVMLILAICNSIALWLFDVPNALFFGVFAALLNVVPFIGPIVGSIIPALFALVVSGSSTLAVSIIIYFIVIQSLENYLITPNIVGKKVSINPMFTLISIFVGNMIWGISGMILFIPLTAVLKQVLDEINGLQPYAQLLGELDKDYFKIEQESQESADV